MRVVLVLGLGGLAAACTRDAVDEVCPQIDAGDLVVTEVRGPQNPDDLLGEWVELYNASGRTVDLIGTKIRFRRKDGSTEVPVLVRRALTVAAGAYVVLAKGDDLNKPTHINYAFGNDYAQTWLSAAAIDVETCGMLVDRAIYDSLPKTGTYSLGTTPPSADDNDLPASWCTDAASAGTPQNPNVACP